MAEPKKSIWTKNGQTCPARQPPKVVQKGLKCAEWSIRLIFIIWPFGPYEPLLTISDKNWFFGQRKKNALNDQRALEENDWFFVWNNPNGTKLVHKWTILIFVGMCCGRHMAIFSIWVKTTENEQKIFSLVANLLPATADWLIDLLWGPRSHINSQ